MAPGHCTLLLLAQQLLLAHTTELQPSRYCWHTPLDFTLQGVEQLRPPIPRGIGRTVQARAAAAQPPASLGSGSDQLQASLRVWEWSRVSCRPSRDGLQAPLAVEQTETALAVVWVSRHWQSNLGKKISVLLPLPP